jgi:hypothetical protein
MERYKSWIERAKSSLEISKIAVSAMSIMKICAINLNRLLRRR